MKRSTPPLPGHSVPTGESRSLVAVLSQGKEDTPAQRLFQKLIGKIKRTREQVKTWEDYGQRYTQRLAGEVQPLEAKLRQKQREMALLIGDILSRKGRDPRTRLRNSDRSTLRELLLELLDSLSEVGPDEELAALHAQYTRAPSLSPEEQESMEEYLKRAEDALNKDQENGRSASGRQGSRSRKKGADDQGQGSQGPAITTVSPSLRQVYRKLVSILHPDREPDPEERERKNQLMQRINQAYETHDLLTLLSLQVELADLDVKQLSSPERLTQYNEVLREQLSRLEAQLKAMRLVFAPLMGRSIRTLSVQAVDKQLTMEIEKLQGMLQALMDDLVRFRDPVQLRARLNEATRERQQDRYLEEMLLNVEALLEMEEMGMNGFPEGPRRPRRKTKRKRGKRRPSR